MQAVYLYSPVRVNVEPGIDLQLFLSYFKYYHLRECIKARERLYQTFTK